MFPAAERCDGPATMIEQRTSNTEGRLTGRSPKERLQRLSTVNGSWEGEDEVKIAKRLREVGEGSSTSVGRGRRGLTALRDQRCDWLVNWRFRSFSVSTTRRLFSLVSTEAAPLSFE